MTLRFAWRAGSHCADCRVLRGRKSGRAEVAVDTHQLAATCTCIYIRTDPTHNPPNTFNYCDHIFATEGLLAKFSKIKTAQKFVVIRYSNLCLYAPNIYSASEGEGKIRACNCDARVLDGILTLCLHVYVSLIPRPNPIEVSGRLQLRGERKGRGKRVTSQGRKG